MSLLREDPHRTVILGAGRGGTAFMEMMLDEELVTVVAIVDRDLDAPGMKLARQHDVKVYTNVEQALHDSAPCVAFNMTGNEMVEAVASEILGAGGVIGGMEASLMYRMINNLKKAKDELHFQATHDPLTGLHNRRYMMEQLFRGVTQAKRYKDPFTVVMLDLDHFKQVNDVYGHAAGDLVLSHLARVLRETVREADVPGRWGGEEFIVLMSHTNLKGARRAAEQLLHHLSSTPLRLECGNEVTISFSAGVAMLDLDSDSDVKHAVNELLNLADSRMYSAKEQGRRRVCAGGDAHDVILNGENQQ